MITTIITHPVLRCPFCNARNQIVTDTINYSLRKENPIPQIERWVLCRECRGRYRTRDILDKNEAGKRKRTINPIKSEK